MENDYILAGRGTTSARVLKYNLSDLVYQGVFSSDYGEWINKIVVSEGYVYVAGAQIGDSAVWKYDVSDLSYKGQTPGAPGILYALAVEGDYIYSGNASFPQRVRRYNKHTLAFVDESAAFGDIIEDIVVDGNYVYALAENVYKLNISDLSTVGASVKYYIEFAAEAMAIDEEYVYTGGLIGDIIKRHDKDTLTFIDSVSYGNNIFAIVLTDDYIYAAGDNYTIRKYNKNMTYTGIESTSYGNRILTLLINGNYIYAAGVGTGYIRRYNLDDLTYVDQSNINLSTLASIATARVNNLEFKGFFVRGNEIQTVFGDGAGHGGAYRSPDFGISWYTSSGTIGASTAADVGFDAEFINKSFVGGDGYLYTCTSVVGNTLFYTQGASIAGSVRQIDVNIDNSVSVVATGDQLYKTADWGETVYSLLDEQVIDVAYGSKIPIASGV